ncbi:hypothetical protein BGY98DRAFT_980012, partial [Russula aff. rugulosa BPL654]
MVVGCCFKGLLTSTCFRFSYSTFCRQLVISSISGLVEQIGDIGVALTTFFLAVHTFVAAVWQVGL